MTEHKFHEIDVDSIKISDRIRKDPGSIEELAISIMTHGLLHPIIINNETEKKLIAGERRLLAHRRIGKSTILVRYLGELSDEEQLALEVEENCLRKDLTWQEKTKATKRFHDLKQKLEGKAVQGVPGGIGWGFKDTAAVLGVSLPKAQQDYALAAGLEEHPELELEKDKTTAMKKLQRMEEESIRAEIMKRVRENIKYEDLLCGNNLDLLRKMDDKSIDLVFTDPPFLGVLSSATTFQGWHKYEDELHEGLNQQQLVMKECYRVLKDDRLAMVFYDPGKYTLIFNLLLNTGFEVWPVPFIWNKEYGIPTNAYYFSYAYEAAFLCSKGKRTLNDIIPNVMSVKRVPSNEKSHPCERPQELYRRLIAVLSEPGEIVLDPYAGSFTTAKACYDTARRPVCIEKDAEYYEKAMKKIKSIKERVNEGEAF